MVSSLDMALSDIIKTKRSAKKPAKKIFKKSAGGIKKRGQTERRNSTGARTPKSPAQRRSFNATTPNRNVVIPSNEKRTVRVNISNLAPSVISSDLQELFGEFHLRSFVVNFNEKGASLGTGDLTLSKANADRLIQKYAGVALDGKAMKFAVIDNSIASRTSFPAQKTPTRRDSAGGRGNQKNGRGGKGVGAAAKNGGAKKNTPKKAAAPKKKREEKPKKTAEELDAELDAYMNRAGAMEMD